MERILKAKRSLAKNSQKGFTLMELIVVIVILAILIAALVPAILGVINRANITADESDVRSMMMAASVAGMSQSPPGTPPVTPRSPADGTSVSEQFTAGVNVRPGTYIIYMDDSVAIGGVLQAGALSGIANSGARANQDAVIGAGAATGTSLRIEVRGQDGVADITGSLVTAP